METSAFGVHLVKFRAEKGLSQAQLGQLLGVSKTEISLWERGTAVPALSIQKTIFKTFGIYSTSDGKSGVVKPLSAHADD